MQYKSVNQTNVSKTIPHWGCYMYKILTVSQNNMYHEHMNSCFLFEKHIFICSSQMKHLTDTQKDGSKLAIALKFHK